MSEHRSAGGVILHDHTALAPLNREVFISAKKSVSAQLRKELEQMSNDPNLFEVCQNAHSALESVHKSIHDVVFPTIIQDANIVCELDAEFGDLHGDRALVDLPEDWKERGPLSLPHVPLHHDRFSFARKITEREQR